MTTQSIIVYRNPAEAAFWESGMLIPLVGGLGVGFILFLVLMKIATKVSRDWRGPSNFVTGAAAVVSICAGVLTLLWLSI